MRTPDPLARVRGFSLVELMVAMVFVSLLMAGLAQVFKGSLSSFVTASERISAGRQSRLALDQIADDLLYAGSTPSTLTEDPADITSTNPTFAIIPNVAYTGTNEAVQQGDQLFMYYDRVLPYWATMHATVLGSSHGGQLGAGNGFKIDFPDPTNTQAAAASAEITSAISAGMTAQIFFQCMGKSQNLLSLGADGTVTLPSDFVLPDDAPANSVVNLIVTREYIRYSIKPLQLDPSNAGPLTPCLVRDVIPYPANGAAAVWTNPFSSTIIAENVTVFHVGLSADGGQTWAGTTTAGAWSTSSAAWSDLTGPNSGAASPTLNYQLANQNSALNPTPSVATGGNFWFRSYPCLVRMDITTRTPVQRAENTSNNTAAYNYQTRSLILNPRHFGLSF